MVNGGDSPIIERKKGWATIKCPYCGAEYRVPATVTYSTCPYCGTTFRLDKPGARIEHFLFKMMYGSGQAYRLARDFATQQIGAAEDLAEAAEFSDATLYYVPIYIFEINVKALCTEEKEVLEEQGLELTVHGGEDVKYYLIPAVDKLPIPLPRDYGFPARSRMYFKPSVLKKGRYLQPVIDPMKTFERLKKDSISEAIEEARISCSKGYHLIDNSKYHGIAHYPFWMIEYVYKRRKYKALVDAADGTVVYLEYPISSKGRLISLLGGVGFIATATLVSTAISMYLYHTIFKPLLYGSIATSAPGAAVIAYRSVVPTGKYKYKPGEEGLYVPVR